MQFFVTPPTGKTITLAAFIGRELYELDEENPMIGCRFCGVYTDPPFEECLAKEEPVQRVQGRMGLKSLKLVILFVCTWDMAQDANELLEPDGLKHGGDELKGHMMAELRSMIVAEEYLYYVDGFSIGSNDFAQLNLGLEPRGPLQTEAMCLATRVVVAPTGGFKDTVEDGILNDLWEE
ncbi:Phosphoenolpyruvate synthase [Symbiodinium microadriaticum]|uniref:Phosphoenolpyruvate synthase n=1 Tax=Symbiodinium microadriaticum TaxID=2951 RepID=A0A1Q9EGA9_SYMMI|nr:Phosphoenolpyruvate synthase [Symbiodinium microadriaticum]